MKKQRIKTESINTLEELTAHVHERVRSILNADILELKLNKQEVKKLTLQQEQLRMAVRRCVLGDLRARDYVKAVIGEIVDETAAQKNCADYVIPFDRPQLLTARDQFEYLYCMEEELDPYGVFGRMCKLYGWTQVPSADGGYCIESEDVEQVYLSSVAHAGKSIVRSVLIQRLYGTLYGYHVADILITDSSVDGVSGGCGGSTREYTAACGQPYMEENKSCGEYKFFSRIDEFSRSYDTLYIMYGGRHVRMKFLSFETQQNLERVVKNLCRNDAKTALCRKTPMVVCSLLDNSRVVVSRPPISDSWTFYVRRFTSSRAEDIESLICDKGNQRAIKILKFLIKSEQNLVISGNQGGGKTTLLKSLIRYIDPRYTIRAAENTFEMNLNNLYPERNIQTLQERENYTVYDAITVFKKTDCDITILGEINEPKVAGAFVQLVQNGGRMAMSTMHHGTTEKLIDYMRNAMISEMGINDVHIAQRQVVDSINFDVHMVRDKSGHHYIERITEIVPKNDTDGDAYECRDILLYDNVNACYVITDMISEYARERMKLVTGGELLMEFVSFMKAEAGQL